MSLSDHHHLGDRRGLSPILARRRKYRTLCDLPVELLCIIISHVLSNRETVRTCTLVCHCLRAVSLEHLFGTRLAAWKTHSAEPVISFLNTYPRIGAKIDSLFLYGYGTRGQHTLPPFIDDTAVLKFTQLLPKLQYLRICSFQYAFNSQFSQQQAEHTQQHDPEPFHLRQFTFGPGNYDLPRGTDVTALFRILSLFIIDTLDVHFRLRTGDPVTFDRSALHRSLKIKDLRLTDLAVGANEFTPRLLKSFAESLEPGYLEGFYTGCNSVELSAIGEVLACAGQGLRSLQIRGSPPCYTSDRKGWEGPLDSTSILQAALGCGY